ncbi:hypothetical protein X943_000087 [Babesia divergens]|uniref:CHCH domain-containing protein n=1 Tax=Babesia divergens TaxID=32595 RepID=A0AAD9LEG0_BABDI|nr:hypothetical protein X943_000087 [Babesia divergens]
MSSDDPFNTLDVDDRIAQTGCVEQYSRLEDCLDKHNREWKHCQIELKDFAKCMKQHAKPASPLPQDHGG